MRHCGRVTRLQDTKYDVQNSQKPIINILNNRFTYMVVIIALITFLTVPKTSCKRGEILKSSSISYICGGKKVSKLKRNVKEPKPQNYRKFRK